ncbi:MAG: hypothetical protein HKN13_14265 [Rhodothermales bacterium]|nr:hypothetical protein [Rhodothermales bacterium]
METIRWFGQQPEKQLIVKIHPAEVVIGTKQPFISEIRKHFPEIPDNVRVIEPDEKVNSWSIIRITDVGLVHTSTVGLEMPLEGVPCVVVSRTHYRGKGFTLDVENRDDYFKLLSEFDPKSVDTASMVGLARRYAYLLFERYQIPFPFTHERQTYDVRALKEVSSADLLKDESIQAIIDGLENHSELLLPE